MQERVFFAVFSARGAADDHDRRFFGVSPGNGVEDVESADAIRDADQADTVDARVSVGRKARAGFVGHRDGLDGRAVEPRESRKGEIARNAEAVADAFGMKVGE